MVGNALGISQTDELAAALLEGVLDDFTRADLAHADLTGRNLTGIRWSDWGTTWPRGTDTGALRAQSQEVGDGSGIFVIIGPGHDDKARHHARAQTEASRTLASRLPAAGMFGLFLEQQGPADQFRFGHKAAGTPAMPWSWEDLDLQLVLGPQGP